MFGLSGSLYCRLFTVVFLYGLILLRGDKLMPIEQHIPDKYDVYYITHGKTQQPPATTCLPCQDYNAKRIITYSDKIDTSCVEDAECAIRLGLEAALRGVHTYNMEPLAPLDGPNEIPGEKVIEIDMPSTTIVAKASRSISGYNWLLGEWDLANFKHNGRDVWTKKDQYGRSVLLFLYGSGRDTRWLVGEDVGSDAGFAYAPINVKNPVELGETFLHFDGLQKAWLPLVGFRFVMSSNSEPRVQKMTPPNDFEDWNPVQPVTISFTHFVKGGDGRLQISTEPLKRGSSTTTFLNSDSPQVEIAHDKLVIQPTNGWPPLSKITLKMENDFVHDEDHPDNTIEEIVFGTLTTGEITSNWDVVAAQYFEYAQSLTPDDPVPALMRALLNNENPNAVEDILEAFPDGNVSAVRNAERFLIRGYSQLFTNSGSALASIDEALKLCGPDLETIAHNHCPMHTHDTFYRAPKGYFLNQLPQHFLQHYFPKAIRMKWFVREWIDRYPDDLGILFENSRRYKFDSMKFQADTEYLQPPKIDILMGTRNIAEIRKTFAQNGAVLLKNVLTPIECEFLRKYFTDGIRRQYPKTISDYDHGLTRSVFNSDRVTFSFLTELNDLMDAVVGSPVKKAYAFLCGYRVEKNARQPWLLGHTDREDNEFTFSITIHHDGGRSRPFPIYAHRRRMVTRRKNYNFPDKSEVYEFVNDIGDAILFRGRQHIHFRHDMEPGLHEYWTILFHYVPVDFDFVDFKERSQANGDI